MYLSQAETSHGPLNCACHTIQSEKDSYAVILLFYNHCLSGLTLATHLPILYYQHLYHNPFTDLQGKKKKTYKILLVISTNLCKICLVTFLLFISRITVSLVVSLSSKLLHVLIIFLPIEWYLNIYNFSWDPNGKLIYNSRKSYSQGTSGISWSFKQQR